MRIELRNVHRSFGAAVALRGVTLTVEHSERVGLVGPNGSGKSTLLRAVMGLVACDGEVRLDGLSPYAERLTVARRLAYVPQSAPRWGAPVREVIRTITALRGLEYAAVEAQARALDLDLAPIASRALCDLSGGMKQKLLLALALAADVSLLILDEPTASLDARGRARLLALLEERARGRTLLLCSHRADDLRERVTRLVALRDGAVTWDGDAAEYSEEASDETPREVSHA